MSVRPCKIYDIRSGSPVLIGDYEAALEWLVANPDVMEGKAPEAKPATKEALKESIAANVAKLNIQLGDLFKSDNRLGLAKMPEQAARELYEQHKALVETLKKIISDVSQIAKLSAEEFADLLGQKATNLFKSAYNAFKTGKTSYNDFLEFNEIEIEGESKEQGELKERKTITSIKEASDISDDVKEALGGDETKYEVLPNEISVREAKAILEAYGIENSRELVLNGNSDIPGAFRTTLAQVLIKAYNEKGEINKAVGVAEGIAKMATDWGQAIQALSLFQFLTPEGQLLAAQREVAKQVEKKFKQHEPKINKLNKEFKKANEEAIDEALDKVAGRVEETKKPVVPRQPKEFAATNTRYKKSEFAAKVKALYSRTYSGIPPELTWLAGYYVEGGVRSFAEFSKEMIKAAGKKVKPYLKSTYKAAQKELGGEGYSNDQEIAKYFADNIDKDIAQVMKDSGIEIQKVIRSHYTEADAAKKTLTDKLIEKLGLDQSDADMIAKAVEVEFNKIATKKKQKALAKAMGPFMLKNAKTKALETKLIELSNLGAFTDQTFKDAYGKAMGFPELTDENAAEIVRLAKIAQDAKEGLPKLRATEDLLKYQANIKGFSLFEVGTAIWMASILSGHVTQVKNTAANIINTASLLANAAAQNRNKKDIKFLLKGLAVGVKRGLLEATDVFDTGYSPIRDKAQVPSVLQRVTFKGGKYNPFNYYKYVSRAMVAADVIMFEGQKEMRAYQMALSKTKEGFPTNKQIDEALKILNSTDDAIEISKQKALDEFNETKANIEARTDIDQKQKEKDIAQAAFDQKRRFYEFMEQARPEGLVSEAHDYAERGTFNNKPEGVLGSIANEVNRLLYKYPVGRFVVPFTNVIANVANETINYSPIGFWRAAKGGSISGNRKEFSEQQKLDLQYKAAMGVMGAAVVMALASIDDDEEDPMFQVTADGYNDFAKNKDLAETGWQPYSIKIGDVWISYKLGPLLLMLSGIGAFKDYQRYRKGKVDDGTITRFGYAFRAALSTVTESTFLPSLNQLLDSLLDRTGQGSMDGLMEWATKTGTNFVPIFGTNLFQQASQTIQRGFDIEEKEYRGTIFGRMLRNIPVARDMYQNVVNGLGEEQPIDNDVIFSTEREGPNEKLWNLLSKNKTTTGIPTIKGVTVLNKEGEEVSVNDKEFYSFAKSRGEYIANTMNARYDELSKMEPKEFSKAMSKIKSDGTAYGKAVVESESYGKESEKLYLPVAQQIEAKLNPNKEAEEKIKGKIESAINTSDSKALSESFNALMKTSKKTRYQTARDNIFDKIVDDKIRPKSIPEDEASRWIKYIMKGEFADKTVGKGKVKLSELVPANERQEYIKRYMKQAAEVNEKLELMDKALPEAINGKWKDQVFKNAAWRKFVGQKPIKRDVIVEKPVEGGLFRKIKGLIK